MSRNANVNEMKLTVMSMCICLGAFVFSYNTVVLTHISTLIGLKNNLSHDELVKKLSICTAAFNLGACIGPLVYRKCVQLVGEQKGLLILDIISIVVVLA